MWRHWSEAATAQAPEPITYAVPGSPLVAERTVELLRRDPRVDLTIVPALSFLDLAWERLGLDPLGAGVRLVDAEQFAQQYTAEGGPHLVAQCWSQALLSEIKLSAFSDDGLVAPDVVLLSHLGLADEQVVHVGWWDLDRTLNPDHLTSLYIPAVMGSAGSAREVARLEELVATLRAECPWDRAQTHGSLMPHLLEESYEVLDALGELHGAEAGGERSQVAASAGHLEEELGDLLFQIVFHARLAQEAGRFTLADVARGVHDKLVHRHPHVFGDADAASADEVRANWEKIKREEKGRSSVTEGHPGRSPRLTAVHQAAEKGTLRRDGGPSAGRRRVRPGREARRARRTGRSTRRPPRPMPPSTVRTRRPGDWSATCSSRWRMWRAGWESTLNWRCARGRWPSGTASWRARRRRRASQYRRDAPTSLMSRCPTRADAEGVT